MQTRTLGILFALVVLTVGSAAWVHSRTQEDPRFEKVGSAVFPGLIDQVNAITEILVESTAGRISIYRDGKIWRVRESNDHLANPKEVHKAVVGITELVYFEPKTERPGQYVRLQLEEPSAVGSKSKRLILKVGDRVAADVIVGRERLFLPGLTVGGVYFRLPDQPLTWLGRGNPEAGALKKDWLAREIVDIDAKRVRQVVIRHPDGETVTVSKASPIADGFSMTGIPAGMRLQYASDANNLGAVLQQLEMDDARRAEGVSVDWSSAVVAEVETFDGLRSIAETVAQNGRYLLRIRFMGEGKSAAEARELNRRTSEWLYLMPEYEVVPMLRRIRDLLVPEGAS